MKALYIGSFDPFTIGHYEVLKQAEELFDEVIICIARNLEKKRRFSELTCANALNFIDGKKRTVVFSDKLATDVAKEYGCEYIIRGLRGGSDYFYEENLAKQYKLTHPSVKVVYFNSDSPVSSSFVYELWKRDIDVSDYLPYGINHLKEEK